MKAVYTRLANACRGEHQAFLDAREQVIRMMKDDRLAELLKGCADAVVALYDYVEDKARLEMN